MGITTGLKIGDSDLGDRYVTKEYFIDRYPELVDRYRFAGLYLWGWNAFGQLGDNSRTDRSVPIQTITYGGTWKQASAGGASSAAIKTDGTLWLWGAGDSGQLGTNDRISRSSPIQTVAYGTNWKQVSCGSAFTAAIKTDGTLWVWGYNLLGQLGTNDYNHRSSPIQTVAYGTNWKQVSASNYNTAAVKTDGTLWGWGNNDRGQLGTNDSTFRLSPVQEVTGGTNWRMVAMGVDSDHTAAIKTDGTLWLWGLNDRGQLGTNDTTNRSSPIQTVAYGTNWKQVSLGYTHTVAIKTDGTLWGWGQNFPYGQLGTNNSDNDISSPVQTVAFGTNWKQVAGTGQRTAAIKTDGTLWVWGRESPALGTLDTTIRISSPVQTVAYGTNWKQVTGDLHLMAIRDESEDLW